MKLRDFVNAWDLSSNEFDTVEVYDCIDNDENMIVNCPVYLLYLVFNIESDLSVEAMREYPECDNVVERLKSVMSRDVAKFYIATPDCDETSICVILK